MKNLITRQVVALTLTLGLSLQVVAQLKMASRLHVWIRRVSRAKTFTNTPTATG